RRHFTSLADLRGAWELAVDGEVVQRGKLPALRIGPGESLDVELPLEQGGGERLVTFRFSRGGEEVAVEQLALPGRRRGVRAGRGTPLTGDLLPDLIAAPPRLHLWRAPTDNDGLPLMEGRGAGPLERWLELGLDRYELELVREAPGELVHRAPGL